MTDLHTHILPHMDDGAPDVETSLAMLRMEREQGVNTVALTSHFYRDREEPEHFLRRRAAAFEELLSAVADLPDNEKASMPEMILGAEVLWMPGMSEWEELESLCYAGTKCLLLELPFGKWDDLMFRKLDELMARRGITPLIAHLDRYLGLQSKDAIETLFELGLPFQISAEPLLHLSTRKRTLSFFKNSMTELLISDCHSIGSRRPNIGDAMDLLKKKLGGEVEQKISAATDEFLFLF